MLSYFYILTMLVQLVLLVWTQRTYDKGGDWYYPAFWSIIFGLATISDKV